MAKITQDRIMKILLDNLRVEFTPETSVTGQWIKVQMFVNKLSIIEASEAIMKVIGETNAHQD